MQNKVKLTYAQFNALQNTHQVKCARVCHFSNTYKEIQGFWYNCPYQVLACTEQSVEFISTYDKLCQWLDKYSHVHYVLQEYIPLDKIHTLRIQICKTSSKQFDISAHFQIMISNVSLSPEYNKIHVYTLKHTPENMYDHKNATLSYIHAQLEFFIHKNQDLFQYDQTYEFYILYDAIDVSIYVLFDM